jgi:hypothetical protein
MPVSGRQRLLWRVPVPAASRRDRVLLGILAGALVLFVLGIDWGLPNTHPWNGDDISPDKPLRVVWNWLFGWHKYPYLHWWLSFALYAPYLLVLAALGRLDAACFPRFEEACFGDPVAAMTVLMALSRGLSVVMALGTAAFAYATARVLGCGRGGARVAAAVAAFAPVVVFYAHTGNVDGPHVFWFAASLYAFARIVRRGAPFDHLAFGAAMGCTLATKEGVVGAYLATCLAIYALHLRRRFWSGPRTARRFLSASVDVRILGLVLVAVSIYVLCNNVIFNWSGFERHLAAWNPSGERMSGFRGGFTSWGRFGSTLAASLAEGMGAPLAVLAGAGLGLAALRRHAALWLALPALSYVLLSLGAARFAPVRFALPLVPIFAVFAGVAFDALWGPRTLRRIAVGAVTAVVLGDGFLRSLNLDLFLIDDSRYRAEAWLRVHAPNPTRIAVFAPERYLPRIPLLGHEVVRLSEDDMTGEALAESGAAWVVLSERFHPRFTGTRETFFRSLKAGQLGWSLAWQGRGTTPLERWLGGPGLVGAVNPTLTILGREPSPPGELAH